MSIKLNFINNSNDASNSDIVIFQKNVAPNFDEIAVAWKVIKNCGNGDNHPFTFPMTFTVGAADSWGNYTPQYDAQNGQLWHMVRNTSGDVLSLSGPSTSPIEVQLRNDLAKGAISGNIYKDSKLLATKTNIAPQQKAVFQFKPTIWIGAVSEVEEGTVINSAVISDVNTELSLLGVGSADIVMTGGGAGVSSTQIEFKLCNVVRV